MSHPNIWFWVIVAIVVVFALYNVIIDTPILRESQRQREIEFARAYKYIDVKTSLGIIKVKDCFTPNIERFNHSGAVYFNKPFEVNEETTEFIETFYKKFHPCGFRIVPGGGFIVESDVSPWKIEKFLIEEKKNGKIMDFCVI